MLTYADVGGGGGGGGGSNGWWSVFGGEVGVGGGGACHALGGGGVHALGGGGADVVVATPGMRLYLLYWPHTVVA
jgi:hypothetical protein